MFMREVHKMLGFCYDLRQEGFMIDTCVARSSEGFSLSLRWRHFAPISDQSLHIKATIWVCADLASILMTYTRCPHPLLLRAAYVTGGTPI